MIDAIPQTESAHHFIWTQDQATCAGQATLPWCSDAPGKLVADITQIRDDQSKAFHYFAEDGLGTVDVWRSHLDDVQRRRFWSGQCGDMVSTMMDLMSHQGVDPSHLWRAIVSTRSGPDHMIGLVEDAAGLVWVVGDTMAPDHAPYPIARMQWKMVYLNHVSEGMVWRKVKALP